MPQAKAAPPTPLQIARNGHIAAALREYMAKNKLTYAEFNEAMGFSRGAGNLYLWVAGKGAPLLPMRKKIHKVTGIPLKDLEPRTLADALPSLEAKTVKLLTPKPKAVRTPETPSTDVLAVTMTANGETRIKLDVTLPLATAMPLVRMLLDAGVVFNAGNNENERAAAE